MDSAQSISHIHEPVMLQECIDALSPALEREHPVVVDATLGLGGHSQALLKKFPGLTLIGLDRDTAALEMARERLKDYRSQLRLFPWVYDRIAEAVSEVSPEGVDGVLFDLGVSSMQLDRSERGFSYAKDAPLDMRMSQDHGDSAADLLAKCTLDELTRILRDWGEERYARRIAKAVLEARAVKPITRSTELVEIVHDAVPVVAQRTGGHPAKRTFQALRIAVNEELTVLADALPAAIDSLRFKGRIAVLSYHSLEDRIVKQEFRRGAMSATPPGLPVELAEHEPYLKLISRGAVEPSEGERERNPRSRSAKLRIVERISLSRGARV